MALDGLLILTTATARDGSIPARNLLGYVIDVTLPYFLSIIIGSGRGGMGRAWDT